MKSVWNWFQTGFELKSEHNYSVFGHQTNIFRCEQDRTFRFIRFGPNCRSDFRQLGPNRTSEIRTILAQFSRPEHLKSEHAENRTRKSSVIGVR